MNRRRWAGVGTIALLRQWTRDVRRHERIIRAAWWKDPAGWVLHLRKTALAERLRSSMSELGHRYQGILYEILESAGVPEEQRLDAHLMVWQTTQTEVRKDPRPWRVPGFLWAACTLSGPRGDVLSRRLKLKLMLRAFVEEIPDSPERRELLRLGYAHQGEDFQESDPDLPALERISQTYPQLHRQLALNHLRVADWFDGALAPADVTSLSAPYAEMDEWLFEKDEPPGEDHVA